MSKYRVKCLVYADGEAVYIPQVRIWFIWCNMVEGSFRTSAVCQSLDSANRHLEEVKADNLKSYLRHKVTKRIIL